MNEHYHKWNLFAPLSLLITGFGLSLIGHAIIAKSQGKSWFLSGTAGLIVFNAGLALFGESAKARALYEVQLETLDRTSSS